MPKSNLKRAWLILKLKGTNKILILKRSKTSRNKNQWDFIGGSTRKRRISPRNLIRNESYEEIGFTPSRMSKSLVVVEKYSIYHYFISTINRKQLQLLELSHEHSKFKFISVHKLRHQRKLHHSIRIFLKHR